ncbi:hypothetical protein HHK36_001690 [Tetracentron sinense]|uniref:DNA polymerase delta subunit 3 n=1 Tax=Tetracentron sinense TaxID=13715 RepID=A0A835DRD2_TETSI|nr:hypothetical protein HHK36_001690 [Tetracentron sinense]
MADIGTLDILGEIQVLVSDKLQVVSYKWLSRNFSVSSNHAKRLLQEFVEKHGSGLEVIYTLSGWLKSNPSIYHIRLVSSPKFAEIKQEFEGNCSVQVYSVQACIPKDPVALWNAEFVQAEKLFNQPFSVDNCLRDNRFCGVSNSFVKRNVEGTSDGVAILQIKTAVVTGPSRSNFAHQIPSVPQPQQGKFDQVTPKNGLQSSPVVTKEIKSESNAAEVHAQASKPFKDKEDVVGPANKKKGSNEKDSSGTGGSLANLWGRASAKSKPSCPSAETNAVLRNPIVTAEAQICAHEAVDTISSDDDGKDINYKRTSNGQSSRKRRVVFDFSDEEDDYENEVNLASPDSPRRKLSLDSKHDAKTSVLEKNNLNLEEHKEDKTKIKQEKATEKESSLPIKEDLVFARKGKTTGISLLEKAKIHIPEKDVNKKDKATDVAPNSPKRRKVLKTRIDERGREVTEVIWEGEEMESNNACKNTVTNTVSNRPPASNKSPALGSTAPLNPVGKAGNKKTGKGGVAKDAKQGNILSFFKRA